MMTSLFCFSSVVSLLGGEAVVCFTERGDHCVYILSIF